MGERFFNKNNESYASTAGIGTQLVAPILVSLGLHEYGLTGQNDDSIQILGISSCCVTSLEWLWICPGNHAVDLFALLGEFMKQKAPQFRRSVLARSVLLACSASAAVLAVQPVFAQDDAAFKRVEITGSRIKTIDTSGQSPIVVMTAETIKAEGIRTVEGLLNNLPQVFADYGGSVSNGATGTATVNLRNLSSSRTLVLINGRRLPPGSPSNPSPDLNQIPVSMIARVEVLTGGAAAVYGADAVAGVVNFVMKNNFEGVEFETNYSFYNHSQHNGVSSVVANRGFALPGDIGSDGVEKDWSVTLGANSADGKGNATVNFTHKNVSPLLESQRDFSSCSLSPTGGGTAFACGGSSTSYPGRFMTLGGAGPSLTVADAAGNTRPYSSATDAYNYGPVNYFQRPSERNSVTVLAHYDINDMAKVYSEFSFHDDNTVAQIAPSGLFGFDASGVNAVKFENPFLSADWKTKLGLLKAGDTADLVILRRNVEGGGRQDHIEHTSYRALIGIKGDIGAWSYDASALKGKVVYQESYQNDFSIARTALALDVVTDPATGKAVCRAKLNGTDPNCVPYNIWALNKVDPAALAYLQTPGFKEGSTTLDVLNASISGDLTEYGIKLPTAKTGLGVAFGIERRTEGLDLAVDSAFSTGDLAGQGGPTLGVTGEYTIDDIFAEVRLPLADNLPFAHSANMNVSFRHSNYSTGSSANTYGTGVDWSPTKDLKVRGSVQQSARSPNVIELYTGQAVGLFNNDSDPCAGATPTATAAQCANTGVTAAQYGKIVDSAAQQYNALYGGNPNLKPEMSKSKTLGFVFTPAKDLNLTVDFFQIDVSDAISVLPPATTLTQCLKTGDQKFCSLITRDRNGTLWALPSAQVVATNLNIASLSTRGLDLGADYSFRMKDLGKMNISFLGTVLGEFSQESSPGLGSYDCAGLYGSVCGTPAPKWRHKLRGTWTTPSSLVAGLTWRYFGAVDVDTSSSNPQLAGTVNPINQTLSAMSYFDVSLSYPLAKNVTLAGSINNLFDKDPPVVGSGAGAPFGNGNTYPVVYDALGRHITLNLTAKF